MLPSLAAGSRQWVDIDMTAGEPLHIDPATGGPPAQMSPEEIVPIIRLYGITEEGNSVFAHIHGFVPYFYIPCPAEFKVTSPVSPLSFSFLLAIVEMFVMSPALINNRSRSDVGMGLRLIRSRHDVFVVTRVTAEWFGSRAQGAPLVSTHF